MLSAMQQPGNRRTRCGRQASQRETVERAEAYVRAHLDTPVPLSRLCRLVGRSERGLREAFYNVRGVGPKRWMLAERLQGARRALHTGCVRPITVTGVATEYGFFELGRFAATYKDAFGETPSQTLRGAGRERVAKHTSTMKGHSDACTG
jgi:AraC family ethanolamine operon transcriptional activator